MAKVIGQYRCGCTYGPVNKSERLSYCSIHGDEIQDEYGVWPKKKIKRKRGKR